MKQNEYLKLCEFVFTGGGFLPNNSNAIDLTDQLAQGELVMFLEMTKRDVSFHRCYFALLSFIWSLMPENFKKQIKKDSFYFFLKHLQRHYTLVYSFKDEEKKQEIYDKLKIYKKQNKSFKRVTKKNIEVISELFGRFDMVEYSSISFSRMSQIDFETYIKNQLPFIYTNLIGLFFKDENYDLIISKIETEFERFLSRL